MVAPLIPIIVGGAMIAGGGATAGKGMMTSGTNPRGVSYGGSPTALQGYRDQYAGGIAGAAGQMQAGTTGLQTLGEKSMFDARYRENDIADALTQAQAARSLERRGLSAIGAAGSSYQPGAQSLAAMNLATTQAANANMSMARSGTNSAMAMRNALNANAQMGVDNAQRAALIRAQEDQFAAQFRMQAAQAQTDAAARMRAGDMGLAGLQTGREQFGMQTAGSVYGGLANLGAGREATYVDAQQELERQQLAAAMDYEQRRQAERQQKRAALVNLGAGLIGAGGNVMSYGFGGGGKSQPASSGGGGGKG